MIYKSTRSNEQAKDYEALIKGIANDGGLFVPTEFPKVNLNDLADLEYKDLCYAILSNFFDFEESKLKSFINSAYSKFNNDEIVPLAAFKDYGFIELYHGPTLAFKDVALSLLPYLLSHALKINDKNENLLILTATSGDTGSAALEGFRSVDNIRILVLYPEIGVSQIQELQMLNVKDDNVKIYSIKGNFDNAQSKVKELFADDEIKEIGAKSHRFLSSANSINIGRLLPQVVYYFSSYFDAVKANKIKMGDKIDVVVPTGNFGNILASYFAKELGLPIDKFICVSNENKVLTDFFNTGEYDINRDFKVTSSPSMDILISSNLERLLYLKLGEDKVVECMKDLKENKKFTVDINKFDEFIGGFATEEETEAEIKNEFDKNGYLIDPHTAVASAVMKKYIADGTIKNYAIVASTASPYKFPKTIANALDIDGADEFELATKINEKTNAEIPKVIDTLNGLSIDKNTVEVDDVKNKVIDFIK